MTLFEQMLISNLTNYQDIVIEIKALQKNCILLFRNMRNNQYV